MGLIQLYNADWRGVVSTRVCPLPDCTSAIVRREINGEYSLTAALPAGAGFLNEVAIGRAVKALVDEYGHEQYFIIKRRQRSLTGGMSIYAEHQSYYYNGVMLGGNTANPGGQVRVVFLGFRTYAVPSITDISTWTYSRSTSLRADFPERPGPKPITELLKSFLIANAGGELIHDGFNVEYVDQMGSDNGARYAYGANLTMMEAEDVIDNYASGIYPFWGRAGDASRPLTTISDKIYNFSGTYPIQNIIPVDFTDKFDTQPSEADLLAACAEYEAINAPAGFPLSIRASRARIAGDVFVDLGDTVTITNTPWGMDQKTRIVALSFDALRGRVQDVELGTINPGFAGAVKNMK